MMFPTPDGHAPASCDVESFFGAAPAHVGVAIDANLPPNECLQKRGRLGKWTARNRRTVINCAVLCVMLAGALCVYWLGSALFFGARFVLAAILHESAALFSWRSTAESGRGVLIANVVEPWRRVADVYRASLLLRDIAASEAPGAVDRERATRLRFASWSLAKTHGRYNFTFDALELVAARDVRNRRLPCACYAEYGVPLNVVVGVPRADSVLYDVRVDADACAAAERAPVRSDLLDVVRDAVVAGADEPDAAREALAAAATACPSGTLDGIAKQSGKRRRLQLAGEQLHCAKACTLLFDARLLNLVK